MSDLLSEYKKLNNSFDREYIFHVGADAGFYSEYIGMVSAILYCLKYGYRFKLYSKTGNFAYEKGWTDFFEPFCDETTDNIHQLYNARYTKPRIRSKHKLKWLKYRMLHPKTYLTFELWDKFFCKEFDCEHFGIPQLGINGRLREAATVITEMIYRHNEATLREIDTLRATLQLNEPYVALHVRRGDKVKEHELSPLEKHMEAMESRTNLRTIFISTDDYKVISEFQQKYPNWKVYTLTEPHEQGYQYQEFEARGASEKKLEMIKLFTSIEIVRQSELFVGTYTSNIGNFLGMVLPDERIVSIQRKSWYKFENDETSRLI